MINSSASVHVVEITHALVKITQMVPVAEDMDFSCVLLDFEKALDTLNYDILLDKLELYGVGGQDLASLCSYLIDRRQVVSINKTSSNFMVIKCGVPRSLILGPIYFIIYIKDLPIVKRISRFYVFADDTNNFFFQRMTCKKSKLNDHWNFIPA